jgi:hypothetical protein
LVFEVEFSTVVAKVRSDDPMIPTHDKLLTFERLTADKPDIGK